MSKDKGIPLSTCPTCGDEGYELHVNPMDKTSPSYYKHWTDKGMVNGRVKTCRNGKTKYEPMGY